MATCAVTTRNAFHMVTCHHQSIITPDFLSLHLSTTCFQSVIIQSITQNHLCTSKNHGDELQGAVRRLLPLIYETDGNPALFRPKAQIVR